MELAPGFSPGHFILAWALFGLNRLDEAEMIAQEVSLRDPKPAMAHLLLAHIHIRRNDYSTGLVELDAYLRLEPDEPLSEQIRGYEESLGARVPDLWSLTGGPSQTVNESADRSRLVRPESWMRSVTTNRDISISSFAMREHRGRWS